MTIAELIEVLKSFPPEHQVLVESSDGGFDGVGLVHEVEIGFMPSPRPWNGQVGGAVLAGELCIRSGFGSEAELLDKAVVIEGLSG
ncbi:hypothetical protein [Stutzerimonas azotifigens]|uniref:hypothetical protein n=1 Tax=Stutzerimonas azotifigens TaxID=291995 RepID=UPI000409F68D|nr:hypothetical protein [Stutzerimonas azotifigens]